MAEPTQSPLSDTASPFAPHNTPEKSDHPPPPSHPLPPPTAIAAHAARREPVRPVDGTGGWYAWTGEDLPRSGGPGSGRGGPGSGRGGAVRNSREMADETEVRDQVQTQRNDGTGPVRFLDSDHLPIFRKLRKLCGVCVR